MKSRGRSATSLHIDRDDEELGYEPGNLAIRKNKDNIRKYLTWQHDERGKPTNFRFHTKTPNNDEQESYPF